MIRESGGWIVPAVGQEGLLASRLSLCNVEKSIVVGFMTSQEGSKMTAEQFESVLQEIRRRQGTPTPMVQVTTAAATIRGRVAQLEVDRLLHRRNTTSPFGLVALEQPGLVPGPLSFVQIADIPDGGIREVALHKTITGATTASMH